MERRSVFVTGATGKVGRQLVAGLLDEGVEVSALVRRPSTAALPAQVETVEGDLRRPETLAGAADGADAAFLLWPEFSSEGAADVVAALAGSVGHVVYLSSARLQRGEVGATEGVWSAVEQLVEDAGVSRTFLRAGGFAANTLAWADQIRAGDVVRLPHLAAARALVHERDLADVAVRALLDERYAGQALTLTGPEVLTQRQQVQAIGAAIGRPLRAEAVSPAVARDELAAEMGSDFAAAAIGHWASLIDDPERVSDDVEWVTGRAARRFQEWASDHAGDFLAGGVELADGAAGVPDPSRGG